MVISIFPQWGVSGAAIATTLAQLIVFLIFVRYAKNDHFLFPHVHLTQWATRQELTQMLCISGPVAAMNVLFPTYQHGDCPHGCQFWGSDAVAVQKVGSQVESISWMTADGFAAATNSFVGQNYGAGNLQRA
ncbi:MATE efflux family protein, partial [gut metagenome]